MKKFLLGALLAVTTMFMASCAGGGSSNYKQGDPQPAIDAEAGTVNGKTYDNTTEYCWKVSMTEKVMGYSFTETAYAWGTEWAIVASFEMEMWSIAQEGYGSATYSYSKDSAKDYESCVGQNQDDDDEDW